MSETWMYPRITDYWDERVGAIDAGAQRLANLPADVRPAALGAIETAVTEHVRVISDDLLAQVAVSFADDLYKAACGITRWDDALGGYLNASAATMCGQLTLRGFYLQYLVDNAWADMTKPLRLFPYWYQAAGFVYVCPAAVAAQLAAHDGGEPASDANDALKRYGSEARMLVNEVIARCQSDRRTLMQLDTDSTEHSFETAFSARGAAGVITVFRDAAPDPDTQVAAWLPPVQG